MAEIIKVTREKYDELTSRLKYLETEARGEIAAAIKTAKEFGDLSENAEYSAAKDAQIQTETEIARLTETLTFIQVLDEREIDPSTVSFGTLVTVVDMEDGEEIQYRILSTLEASSRDNKISDQSPIGKALIGHKKGETIKASTPGGIVSLKIKDIKK
ncbi:MAG: transcription elongation factor GreA [Clostridia bacterium]|nr:transcription elongation factor GreA [Clostridia bacterium]